jgi:DNA-binding MarR family transcriptional regulator
MSSPKIDPRLGREAALMQEAYTAGQLVNVLVTRELKAVGVPPQDFSFLGWIAELEPVTPGRLAAETGLPATTIRDYVRRSVARGMLHRKPNPDDGRSYHLVLSAKGNRLMQRGWPAVVAAYARLEPELDNPARYLDTIRDLRAALKQVLAEDEQGA